MSDDPRSDVEKGDKLPVVGKRTGIGREINRADRLKLAGELLADGFTYNRIVDELKQRFGIHDRTAQRDIADMKNTYLPQIYGLDDVERAASRARARAERLLEKACQQGDLSAQLGAQKWLGEVDGLTAAVQIARMKSQVDPDALDGMSTDELKAMAKQLLGVDGK